MTVAEHQAAVYATLGGLFLLGAGVLLVFHCSSAHKRKTRRQVEDGVFSTKEPATFSVDVDTLNKKWRETQRKYKKSMARGVVPVPSITIIVTPPTPSSQHRSQCKLTSSDGEENSVNHNDANVTTDAPCAEASGHFDVGLRNGAAMTSTQRRDDVCDLMTSNGDAVLDDDVFVMRPRLSSMETGISKSDFPVLFKGRDGS